MVAKGMRTVGKWLEQFSINKLLAGKSMPLSICGACGCVVGKVRGNNEDNFSFCGEYLPKENQGLNQTLVCELRLDKPVTFAVLMAWAARHMVK